MPRPRAVWQGPVERRSYGRPTLAKLDDLAAAGSGGDWARVVELLDDPRWPVTPNSWQPESAAWHTPLHHAAQRGAPRDTVMDLLARGAWRAMKDADGLTAYDLAHDSGRRDLLDALANPLRNRRPDDVARTLDQHLRDVIDTRLAARLQVRYPSVRILERLPGGTDLWFPVPGMVGGFQIALVDDHIEVTSWSRVVEGSGQRHLISTGGSQLVAEGFG